MMRNSKYIAMALGVVVLLAGCNAKSPTSPKPTPVPAFNISLTPETTTAKAGDSVLVTARVTAGSANLEVFAAVSADTRITADSEMPPQGSSALSRRR